MDTGPESITTELVERAIAGEHQFTLYGKAYRAKLRPHELASFERAREVNHVVFREPRDNLRNAWWLWCAATHIPWVGVRLSGGAHAMVGLDMGPARRILTADGQREMKQIMATQHGFAIGSPLHCWSMRMPRETAVDVALATYSAAMRLGVVPTTID